MTSIKDLSMVGRCILRSSYADILVEVGTGEIVLIDYAAMGGTNEWDDVARFDPATLPACKDEADVLDVGGWTHEGAYFAPVEED